MRDGIIESMLLYQELADELIAMLSEDQAEKRRLGMAYFHETDRNKLEVLKMAAKKDGRLRANRMLEILHLIKQPSLSNIGRDGAQAMSVLALHNNASLQEVLDAFNDLYENNKGECLYEVIPAMTDLLLLRSRKPQRFGTQWMFDADKWPYLPSVESMEGIDEKRAAYGVEPLRWPKSLAIPEGEQPWLKQPLSTAIIRDMTDKEWREFVDVS